METYHLGATVADTLPAAYRESHAGAADYALTHSLARDYGAYYFFYNAHRSERLLRTPYYQILRSLVSGVDEPRTYPGSPLIAMRLLKDAASRFLFCDIDQDSLSTIHCRADELKLAAGVETEQANGATTMGREISVLPLPDAPCIFAHLDPYLPFANHDDGRNTVDLFCELTATGAHVTDSAPMTNRPF